MMEHHPALAHKLRYIFAAALVLADLFLIGVLLSVVGGNGSKHQAARTTDNSPMINVSDSSNPISIGMANAVNSTAKALDSIGRAASATGDTLGSAAGHSGRFIVSGFAATGRFLEHGTMFLLRGTGSGIAWFGRAAGTSIAFVLRLPLNLFEAVSSTPAVSSVIQPAGDTQVPVINADAPVQLSDVPVPKVQAASQTTPAPMPKTADSAIGWPIHGEITTEFGVPEPPYEPIHTGIDISDGEPSGVTPVKAFKPGKVIAVIHGGGLGNHIIVDHGDGMTSVYGHMYSTAVTVGQQVDHNTTLGLEGTTGASTGPHVHFEIRLNDKPVNPHLYIQGHP